MMLEDVKRTEAPDQYENVKKSFIGFAKGWNSGFGKWVERYECLEIPDEYKNIQMGYDTPLVFCL